MCAAHNHLTLKEAAGAFCRGAITVLHCSSVSHAPLSAFHPSFLKFKPVAGACSRSGVTTVASGMDLLRAVGGMVTIWWNKLSVPLYFLCGLLLRYQETDASSTILASCCNLPVQLNDGT